MRRKLQPTGIHHGLHSERHLIFFVFFVSFVVK